MNKNKKNIFLILFFFSVLPLSAQKQKNIDFIIIVDEELGLLCAPQKIYLQNGKGEKTDINFSYHPGCLSIDIDDYEKIKTFDGKIELHFGWYKHKEGETLHYFYDIPFDKLLFERRYVIIKIYNTDDKRYKKMYYPLEGKNYNYYLETSNEIKGLLTKKQIKKLKLRKHSQ